MTYFRNQKTLASGLNEVIDRYWSSVIDESTLVEQINDIFNRNEDMIFDKQGYTSIIKQRLGKKRINLINKIRQNQFGGHD